MHPFWLFIGITHAQPTPCADAPCVADAPCADAHCAADRVRELLRHDRIDAAITTLKADRQRFPHDPELGTLLGVAYHLDDNDYWSIRTLDAVVTAHPDACEARTWLAWAQLHIQNTDGARRALETPACVATQDPVIARILLLRALLAWSVRADAAITPAIEEARRSSTAWPADKRAIVSLSHVLLPQRLDEITWRVDLQGGWSSDPRVGSQLLPAASTDPASARLQAATWLRWAPDLPWTVRPSTELQGTALSLGNATLNSYDNVDVQARLGVTLGHELPRVLLGLRPGVLIQTRPENGAGPRPYDQVLRVEAEAELNAGLVGFGGAGRRAFADAGRSRTEIDGGLGWQGALGTDLAIMGAASGRWHHANNPRWGVVGASGTLTARWSVRRWQLWPSARVSWDRYAGWPLDDGGVRRDLVTHPALLLWSPGCGDSPPLRDLRLGLETSVTWQSSTDPDTDLVDQRVMLRLRWSGLSNPSLPHTAHTDPVYPFAWGLTDDTGAADERVQDLVRQQERAQGGCGCGH